MDFALDLNGIIDELYDYRDYANNKKIYNPKDLQEYSIYKRKKRLFGLF